MKNMLLYLALFLLIILLFLPAGLRLFGNNLYKNKKITEQNDLEILNCTKIDETINTSFLNGKAYNIKYEIRGNYVLEENENININENENKDELDVNKNVIVNDFRNYAKISFVEDKGLTEFRIAVNLLDVIPEKLQNHTKSINEVKDFYNELLFSCTTQKY